MTGVAAGGPSNYEIGQAVGQLRGVVETMAKHADDDREYLRTGFGRIHERLDEQAKELTNIRFGIETGAKIDAQVRTELDGVKKDIKPLVARERMLRWALGVLAAAATASGISVAVAAEQVRFFVRSWLGF